MSSINNPCASFGTPKRKLVQGNLVVTSTSQSAVFNPTTKSDSFPSDAKSSGGEGEIPHSVQRSIYGFSPEKQKPLSDLDLSDDPQPDITELAEVELAKEETTGVIVVDALSQRLADDMTEVTVTERVESSPHRVICHTPRAAQLSLRNSGDTHKAANVNVDLIHSVTISNTPEEQAQDILPTNKSSENESSLSSTGVEMGAEVPQSLQDISIELERSKAKSPVKVASQQKKKTGRVVASRLMETTAAHRAKSVGQSQQESYRSTIQSSRASRKPRYLNDQSNLQKTTSSKPPIGKTGHTTPATHVSKTRRQVSTPEFVAPNESFDVSALQTTKVHNWVLNETESFIAPADLPSTAPARTAAVATSGKKSKVASKKNASTEVTQDSIDICYARYLQWLFLSSKAAKAIESEEGQVMSQLQRLWVENQRMRQKLSSLQQEYDRLHHVTGLDEMLDLQKGLLGPIVHELPQLSQNYQSMAEALDTTRHELRTEGVNIPDNKPGQQEFEEAMTSALDESEQLLADITSRTRRDVSTASQYAQAVDSLSKCASDEQNEINRCKDLVKTAQKLANWENSLKIEEVEMSRCGDL